MPALPPVPGTLLIVNKYLLGSDADIINKAYFTYSGSAPTNSELDTMANNWSGQWSGNMAPFFHTSVTLEEVVITDLTSDTAARGTHSPAFSGTEAGTQLPAGVAACLSQHIDRRYRGGHPRMYFCAGVAGDLLTPDTWTAAFAAAVVSGWEAQVASVAAGEWTGSGSILPVNVSYFKGFHNVTFPSGRVRSVPTLRPTPVVDSIRSYSLNPKTASQRRRNQQSA